MKEKRSVRDVADVVSDWGYARLFAECIDKIHFDPVRSGKSVDEQAFEQVVSRFEQYLEKTDERRGQRNYGLLVHDNKRNCGAKTHLSYARFSQAGHFVDER
jgi:hypothetical protein